MARTLLFHKLIIAMQKARQENLQAQGLPPALPYNAKEKWSRRKFLQSAAVGSVAALTNGSLLFPESAWATRPEPKIVIIGAGIAGLNAAYQLKKVGLNAAVYEARNRVGGRMLSKTLSNGLVVDLGAELINSDHLDMLALAEELNITLFDRIAATENPLIPKNAYYFDGINKTEEELIADLQALVAQINADSSLVDEDWVTYAPQFDAISVADYFAQHAVKIGQPYILELYADIMRAEYGVEMAESSTLQLLFTLPVIDQQPIDLISYSDEKYVVVGGSAKITDALAQELEGQINLNKELKQIRKQGNNYVVTFADDQTIEADYLIVTIPFVKLKEVEIVVNLPRTLRKFINEAKLGANERLLAGFDSRPWLSENGFTGEAWSDLGFAVTWDSTQSQSQAFPDVAFLNFYLGGDQARALSENGNHNELGNQFIAGLNQVIPGIENNSTGVFKRTNWLKSRYSKGSYTSFAPGQLTEFEGFIWIESENPSEAQQVNVGNLVFAGEHLSELYYGFMNGGAQTGRLAANLVASKVHAI